MGLANLPLASGHAHAHAFVRLGWNLDQKRRGRGKHLLLTKSGIRATLSIPDHKQVKRTIIASLIKLADVDEDKYLRAFGGEKFDDLCPVVAKPGFALVDFCERWLQSRVGGLCS
jgi:hypothetical protein